MHHIHLLCIVLLVATGFYIHKPNFDLLGISMNLARRLHFYAGFIILLNSVVRVYWAFFGAPRDIKYFMPEKENKGKLFPMMSYYYFLRKTKPRTSRYNGWQKATYVLWTIVTWGMGFTGLAMLWRHWGFGQSVAALFGGLNNLYAVHYLGMWYFVFTVLFHVYLVFCEDFKAFLVMFLGVESKEAH